MAPDACATTRSLQVAPGRLEAIQLATCPSISSKRNLGKPRRWLATKACWHQVSRSVAAYDVGKNRAKIAILQFLCQYGRPPGIRTQTEWLLRPSPLPIGIEAHMNAIPLRRLCPRHRDQSICSLHLRQLPST